METAGIEKVIGVLNDLHHEGVISQYAVGGAFAATLHNEPISTVDLDIFFLLSHGGDKVILSLSDIYDYAKEKGFSFDHEFVNIYGWLVQFVESSRNDLWREAVEESIWVRIGDTKIPVIGPEHLVAMWLFAGRAKDYQKIEAFLISGLLSEPKLMNILKRHDLWVKWEQERWRFTGE